jgi:hypothetical protein
MKIGDFDPPAAFREMSAPLNPGLDVCNDARRETRRDILVVADDRPHVALGARCEANGLQSRNVVPKIAAISLGSAYSG